MPKRYAKGKFAVGECARSGRKMLLKDMVSDGYYPSLIVDPEWYEGKHPQESLPEIEDPVALWRPAPERDLVGATLNVLGGGGDDSIAVAYGYQLGQPELEVTAAPPPSGPFIGFFASIAQRGNQGPGDGVGAAESYTIDLVSEVHNAVNITDGVMFALYPELRPGDKVYWEYEMLQSFNSGQRVAYGVTYAVSEDAFFSGSQNGALYNAQTGDFYLENVNQGTPAITYTTGDRMGCAVDITARLIWFAKNGVWLNGDPATATGGLDFSSIRNTAVANGPILEKYLITHGIEFGANNEQETYIAVADFTYTVPTGFTAAGALNIAGPFNDSNLTLEWDDAKGDVDQFAYKDGTVNNHLGDVQDGNIYGVCINAAQASNQPMLLTTSSKKNTGKYYAELTAYTSFTIASLDDFSLGIVEPSDFAQRVNAQAIGQGNGVGVNTGGIGIAANGSIQDQGSNTSFYGTSLISSYDSRTQNFMQGGDTFMIAVDFDNGVVWFGLNGTWINGGDPTDGGVTGHSFTVGTEGWNLGFNIEGGTLQAVFNMGGGRFAYTVPAGYSFWDSSGI